MTAFPYREVEKKINKTEADGYVLKPFDFSEFKVFFDLFDKTKHEDV